MKEYLLDKDIVVNNDFFKGEKFQEEGEIEKQIILINDVHRVLMGFYSKGSIRIRSNLGRRLENIYSEIKKLESDYVKRQSEKSLNVMDEFIIKNGQELLKYTKDIIRGINRNKYVEIIYRSMKRNEITLGRTDEANIRVFDNIEIGTLEYVSYNLVEEDIYNYLKKIKHRKIDIDLYSIIKNYVDLAHLNKVSEKYIQMLVSIPNDTLRQWYRYKQNKRDIEPEEYYKNINRCYKQESKYMF